MQAPLFVRPLLEKEQAELEVGRRSSQGFTVRRSQMLLASAQGASTTRIAQHLGCNILSADELEARVCAYYRCPREPHLVMPEKIA